MTNDTKKKDILLSTGANYLILITSVISLLISIPIGIGYFGDVVYGIWFVICSIIAYLKFADLGLGFSSITLISQLSQKIQKQYTFQKIFFSLIILSIIELAIVILITIFIPDWIWILGNLPSNVVQMAGIALFVMILFTLIQLPFDLFLSIFSGFKKVYWNRIYVAITYLIALLALLFTVYINGNLIHLSLFTGFGYLMLGVLSGIHLFTTYPFLISKIEGDIENKPSNSLIFSSAIRFFLIYFLTIIIMRTNILIISHYLGPESVTPFAVTFRLFDAGLLIMSSLVLSLWPFYGEAFGKKDWKWINDVFNRTTLFQLILGGLIWIGGIYYAKLIISIWVNEGAYAGDLVVFALGGFIYLSALTGSCIHLINGINPTNAVILIIFGEACLNIGFSVFLIQYLGIAGPALGALIAILLVSSWGYPLYIKYRSSNKIQLEYKMLLLNCGIIIPIIAFSQWSKEIIKNSQLYLLSGAIMLIMYFILSWMFIPDIYKEDIKWLIRRDN